MKCTRFVAMVTAMLAAGVFAPLRSAGQSSETDSASTEAAAAYDAKDWAKAARLYATMAKAHPETPRLWYRLADAQRELGQLDAALQTMEQGLKAGLPPVFAEYLLGSIYAQKRENDLAFAHLHKALDAGYNDPQQLASDQHLVALRADSRFAKLRAQAEHNLKPCANTPENRQFDFWLGEWDVQTTEGAVPAGKSKIELILGDCVIQENWQSSGNPYAGKSYNVYNAGLKRWEQFWVDNSAGNIFFYGGLKEGVMDYWTDEIPQPTGPALKRHLQFIRLGPDKLRQFSQGSTDGGKTWKPEYDFTYLRAR